MRYTPSPYQTYATRFIEDHPQAAVLLPMGLGKTIITLTALADLLTLGDAEKILIIAPLNVARTVWAEEAAKWDHTAHLRCVKILGDARAREKALQADADLYVINRENVKWLVDYQIARKTWPFDTVVIDELSSFKAASTARWKALWKARKQITRMIGLTGTPAPNSLIDLWAQITMLDEGQRFGRSLTRFKQAYFVPDSYNPQTGIIYHYALRPGADGEIYGKIRDMTVSMQASDYIKLPDRIDRTVPVELTPSAWSAYKRFARDLVVELGDEEITAANAAVLCNKLLQLASGEIYSPSGTQTVHDGKLIALKEIVDTATSPVLIFYAFRHEASRIMEALPQAEKLTGAEQVERWNQGNIPILLAHPDSAGHGLNLQAGGHTIVWYSLTWSLEKYQQACARLHRRGQTQPVIIHHLIAKGTVDERVMAVLAGKDDGQNALLQAVKASIADVMGAQ